MGLHVAVAGPFLLAGSTEVCHTGFGAEAAIELAAALAPLPERVVVVGIEGACFEGDGLSAPVAAAIDGAVAAVAGVIRNA